MLNGLQNNMPAGSTAPLMVNGQSVTVKSAIATLSAYLASVAAVATAKVQYHQAVIAMQAQQTGARNLITGLAAALRVLFGKGNPQLEQFGVSSGVRKAPSPTTLVEAASLAKATRVARNTMGPKERLKVTAPVATPASNTSTSGTK
jgi:hypothetical protein